MWRFQSIVNFTTKLMHSLLLKEQMFKTNGAWGQIHIGKLPGEVRDKFITSILATLLGGGLFGMFTKQYSAPRAALQPQEPLPGGGFREMRSHCTHAHAWECQAHVLE
jgi:hypothetical protein